jgi:peptide/nickel transport system substrate-binding protein
MRMRLAGLLFTFWVFASISPVLEAVQAPSSSSAEPFVSDGGTGAFGGRLVVAQRTEPKTFQPVLAFDSASREVIRLMTADLIHINRLSQKTEPGLAKSWTVSKDGRKFTLQLRRGLQFSDGHPMDAEDVLFTFQVYLDEKIQSPQRDLLLVDGKPLKVSRTGPSSLEFEFAQPYAAAERLFDSIAILPRHLLEDAYRQGKLGETWGLMIDPARIAGMGPFRLKRYIPGDRTVLERNPYYWKADSLGRRLPYLDEIVLLSVGSEDAQVLRFRSGETDLISRIGPANFTALEKSPQADAYRLFDAGPGLEYNFLFFNLNSLEKGAPPEREMKQTWFREPAFRRAVSAAIDRENLVRLVYQGRATSLWSHVTPGNKLWWDAQLPRPSRSLSEARKLLASAGFHWNRNGTLEDVAGRPVEFSVITSSGNVPRSQMTSLLQTDLSDLGMRIHVVPLEFRSLLDRVMKTHEYDACILGIASGDADPNGDMNVLLSSGGSHLWNPSQPQPATPWEAEIDQLMRRQLSVLIPAQRKQLYDRVQQLMIENQPLVFLASPDILAAAKKSLGNIKPANLEDYVLWNAEEIYWDRNSGGKP